MKELLVILDTVMPEDLFLFIYLLIFLLLFDDYTKRVIHDAGYRY